MPFFRSLVLLWWSDWQGVGLYRWTDSRTYDWSLLLGWVELRRLR